MSKAREWDSDEPWDVGEFRYCPACARDAVPHEAGIDALVCSCCMRPWEACPCTPRWGSETPEIRCYAIRGDDEAHCPCNTVAKRLLDAIEESVPLMDEWLMLDYDGKHKDAFDKLHEAYRTLKNAHRLLRDTSGGGRE